MSTTTNPARARKKHASMVLIVTTGCDASRTYENPITALHSQQLNLIFLHRISDRVSSLLLFRDVVGATDICGT